MECKRCGRTVLYGKAFCSYCGEKVTDVTVEDYVGVSMKKALINPFVIICLLVFTVMVGWQFVFFSQSDSFSEAYEEKVKSELEYEDFWNDDNSSNYSYRSEDFVYLWSAETTIEALYEKSNVDANEVDDAVSFLLNAIVFLQALAALGLWMFFANAQRTDTFRLNTHGVTVARISLLLSMLAGLGVVVMLLIMTADLSEAVSSFRALNTYEQVWIKVDSILGSYSLFLIIAGVVILIVFISAMNALKHIAESCDMLIPEALSAAVPVQGIGISITLLFVGVVEDMLITLLIPAIAFAVYGITIINLRKNFDRIGTERSEIVMSTRRSRIFKT